MSIAYTVWKSRQRGEIVDNVMVQDEKKSVRLVTLVEPSRMGIIEELAKRPEFKVNGQPSNAAVVRAALDLFFADLVRK
jgi:hypothetical protein